MRKWCSNSLCSSVHTVTSDTLCPGLFFLCYKPVFKQPSQCQRGLLPHSHFTTAAWRITFSLLPPRWTHTMTAPSCLTTTSQPSSLMLLIRVSVSHFHLPECSQIKSIHRNCVWLDVVLQFQLVSGRFCLNLVIYYPLSFQVLIRIHCSSQKLLGESGKNICAPLIVCWFRLMCYWVFLLKTGVDFIQSNPIVHSPESWKSAILEIEPLK